MANTADYVCTLCGHALQKTGDMGARTFYKCPNCGMESTRSDEHDYVPSQKTVKDRTEDRKKPGREPYD